MDSRNISARFSVPLRGDLLDVFESVKADLRLKLGDHIGDNAVVRWFFVGSLSELARNRARLRYEALANADLARVEGVLAGPATRIQGSAGSLAASRLQSEPESPPDDRDPPELGIERPLPGHWLQSAPGREVNELEFFAPLPWITTSPGHKDALDRVDEYYRRLGWRKFVVSYEPGRDVPEEFRHTVVFWADMRSDQLQEGSPLGDVLDQVDMPPPDWSDGQGRRFYGDPSPDTGRRHVQQFPEGDGIGHLLPYDWGLGN